MGSYFYSIVGDGANSGATAAAMASPITPATLGVIVCMSRKLLGSSLRATELTARPAEKSVVGAG